jgi:hypothetical protein
MSNINRIEMDLGGLTVCDPGTPTVSIAGPDTVPSGAICYWSAVTQNGIPPYGYQWSGILSGSGPTVSNAVYSPGWLNIQLTDGPGRQSTNSMYISVEGEGQEHAPDQA